MRFDWILLVGFLTVLILIISGISGTKTIENFSTVGAITKKDKVPLCSEAAIAYNTLMRYIAQDITGEGAVIIRNMRDTFFEIDEDCLKTKKCSPISIKRSLEPDSLYSDWSNPLKCS